MKFIMMILVCGWLSCAFASEPVGKVVSIEGVADVLMADGQTVTLREGQSIGIKERVRTKSYSKVSIALVDKSVLKLAPSSCISIEELKLGASWVRQSCVVVLSRGKVEAVVAKSGAPDTFIIKTPNAQGSVKGSDIFVSYFAGRTGLFVKQGAMSVVNPEFPEVRRTLTTGSCVYVPLVGPPEQPRRPMKVEMTMHKRDVEPELKRKWIPSENSSVMNAVLTSVNGTVRIHKKSAQDWIAAPSGEVIAEGDKLQTAEDGRAQIRLGNGNYISVEPSTELSFKSLRYDAESGKYRNEFEVSEGQVLAVVEKISGESTFEVRTPTAVSGVRGTIMKVVVDPRQPGMLAAPQTHVFFEGGRGDVISLSSGAMQQLLPGQNVRVDAQGVILQPALTSPEERSMIMQSVEQNQMVGQFAGPKGPQREGFLPFPGPPKGKEGLSLLPPPPGGMLPPPPPRPPINPDIWYRSPMKINTAPAGVNSAAGDFRELSLKKNGTWNAIFNGAYSTTISSGWNLQLNNSATGDFVDIINIPVLLPMSAPQEIIRWVGVTDFAGQAKGPEVDRTLTLNNVTVEANTVTHHLVVDANGGYDPL